MDLKAEQKDLEATTSFVNVINQTLAEASEAVGSRRGSDQTPQEGDRIPEHGGARSAETREPHGSQGERGADHGGHALSAR